MLNTESLTQAYIKLEELQQELEELCSKKNSLTFQYVQEESPKLYKKLEKLNEELRVEKAKQHQQDRERIKKTHLQSQKVINELLNDVEQKFNIIKEKENVSKQKQKIVNYIEEGYPLSKLSQEDYKYYEQYRKKPEQFDRQSLEQQLIQYNQEIEKLIHEDDFLLEQQKKLRNVLDYPNINIEYNSIIKNIKKKYTRVEVELKELEPLNTEIEKIDAQVIQIKKEIIEQEEIIRKLTNNDSIKKNITQELYVNSSLDRSNSAQDFTQQSVSSFSSEILEEKIQHIKFYDRYKYTLSYNDSDELAFIENNIITSNNIRSTPFSSTPKRNNKDANLLQTLPHFKTSRSLSLEDLQLARPKDLTSELEDDSNVRTESLSIDSFILVEDYEDDKFPKRPFGTSLDIAMDCYKTYELPKIQGNSQPLEGGLGYPFLSTSNIEQAGRCGVDVSVQVSVREVVSASVAALARSSTARGQFADKVYVKFAAKFFGTNSTGIKKMQELLYKASQQSDIDESQLVRQLSSIAVARLTHRWNFWLIKGRAKGVQELYTSLRDSKIKTLKVLEESLSTLSCTTPKNRWPWGKHQ